MCACLPTYKPILPNRSELVTSLRRLYSSITWSRSQLPGPYSTSVGRTPEDTSDRRNRHGRYNKFNESVTEDITLTDIEAMEHDSQHQGYTGEGIIVRNDIQVV